jgi:hypothetical protein
MRQDDFLLADGGKLNRRAAVFAGAGKGHDLSRTVFRMGHGHALLEEVRRNASKLIVA